jgi:DNA-directed RNA polymerase subunit L
MEPVLNTISEEGDILRFTLQNINVSFANAIRRTLLSDIPVVSIYTETHETNQCKIHTNTGRLHNEILKQRLSCIPIHSKKLRDDDDGKALPDNYQLEVNLKNETDNIIFVTTEDFRLKEKDATTILSKDEQQRLFPGLFPKNNITQSYIDFARLRPKLGDGLAGEQLHLTADFSISTAKESSMFNVVSKCAYGNTRDDAKVNHAWEQQEHKLRADGETDQDIRFQKSNYMILDAQRQSVENSFDFVIQTLGIYDNRELIRKACIVLQNKFIDFIELLDADSVPIYLSETTMANCYDMVLENEDYTMGKCIEYVIYTKFYEGTKSMSFCGFKKFHPHDNSSKLRVAFEKKTDKSELKMRVREACVEIQDVFKQIFQMFKE